MITLRSHSTRAVIRTSTLLMALTSLLLAMWTPLVGVAVADDDNTCDKAYPDLIKIDQDSGTLDITGLSLEWGGAGDSATNAVDYTVADGYVLDLCVKGGDGTSTPAYYADLTGTGTKTTNHGDVSHIAYRLRTLPDASDVTVSFTKVWRGDDEGSAIAAIELRDGGTLVATVSEGGNANITSYEGRTLAVQEVLTSPLPAGCSISDTTWTLDGQTFDGTLEVPATHQSDTTYAIAATNTVDCDEPDEPIVRVSFTKVWAGDDEGNAVAAIELRDGESLVGTVTEGTSLDITDEQGDTLAVREVLTTSLPAGCAITGTTWMLDGEPFDGTLEVGHHEADRTYAITATNTVDCEEPPPPPPPPVTGAGSVAKAWAGDVISLDGVTVTFTAKVDNGASFEMEPGDSRTLQLGQTLTITDELVTGLPDNCSYESSLPDDASFTATSTNRTGTITVTNDVTCVADEVVGSATVTKAWTGAAFDDTDVTVSFTAVVDDGAPFTMQPGDVEPLLVDQTLTILDEEVTGLPDSCTYESSLPDGGLSFTATEGTPVGTLEVTNDVTCGGVAPEVVVNVRLEKVWDVDDPEDELDTTTIDVAFTVSGYPGTFEPGDVLVATPGDVLEVSEQTGTLPARCELTDVLAAPYTVTDATDQVLTVTNVVACAEVQGVVVTLPRTGLATGSWAMVASLLAAAGALLLLATREEPTGRRG